MVLPSLRRSGAAQQQGTLLPLQDHTMTNVPDLAIVALRRDDAGRYAIFSRADMPSGGLLPWWLVTFDTGADTQFRLRIGLDEDTSHGGSWTARDIARVAYQRHLAEIERQPNLLAVEAADHLEELVRVLNRRPGQPSPMPISFHAGTAPSAYRWDAAQRGGDVRNPLRLCPDPDGQGKGITLNLLLVVLDQVLLDAALARPTDGAISLASSHASAALRCEVARLRGEGESL
jgi:hypothetical protein